MQERIGKYGKKFNLLKFATMLKASPSIGSGTITLRDDPRVLPVGKWLRKTKINELPQLLNILLGDMSFVGPRPQAEDNFSAFPIKYQEIITKVKPGLSGIGSIIFRNEEDIISNTPESIEFYNNIIVPYKGQVESWYCQNQTIIVYFLVIFVTVWVILFPSSQILWRVFKGLPTPPDELSVLLRHN